TPSPGQQPAPATAPPTARRHHRCYPAAPASTAIGASYSVPAGTSARQSRSGATPVPPARQSASCLFSLCHHCARHALPVKRRAGIGLATRRHMFVADNVIDDRRILLAQRLNQDIENSVLMFCVRNLVRPFKLYADGEVIAGITPLPAGTARMPGTLVTRHILDQFTISTNKKV